MGVLVKSVVQPLHGGLFGLWTRQFLGQVALWNLVLVAWVFFILQLIVGCNFNKHFCVANVEFLNVTVSPCATAQKFAEFAKNLGMYTPKVEKACISYLLTCFLHVACK